MNYYTPKVATALVVANMIGTGVFTSLGFQLLSLSSPIAILILWAIGGVCALCGALCYAELGSRHPASGGEYHFLTELIHPYAGFVSGAVSATVGFAAPVALAALTFGSYLEVALLPIDAKVSASVLIIAVVVVHSRTHHESSAGQYYLTALKLMLILLFIGYALIQRPEYSDQLALNDADLFRDIFSSDAAIALIYVTYAFSGWNAATYILGEIENPARYLPRILMIGCGLVAVVYVALNTVFLSSAPIEALRGELEIAYVVAHYMIGPEAGFFVSLVLAGILTSTVSAMILAGPRALQRLGEDYPRLSMLGRTNEDGIPVTAIIFMAGISFVFLWTSTFEQILLFAGLLMAFNTFVTVIALFVSRNRHPDKVSDLDYRMPLYPLPALLFLAITGWTLVYSASQFPLQVLVVLLALVFGLGLFKWAQGR
ncbi:amino acid permease [Halieaceae bacterium IMCC8485]|jgi:APA family basic amino acid/polyamine antiporter|uniref:Amino acid permease n=1 Tax=Candidatus Seongchinamella marina TaxID=2518990 RepID=A0ABT3SPW6_9GAMM|nr:amino acid permease [Candidatus Seongchinamella marina]MCX2972036.1 amino acid permease [Candidatus Seongchinamella marina]